MNCNATPRIRMQSVNLLCRAQVADAKRHLHNRDLTSSVRSMVFILGATLASTACGPSDSDFTEFSTYKSPNGKYYVVVDSAHGVLAYGPETVRVSVIAQNHRVKNHVVTTKIANDGGGISDANVKVKWVQPDIVKFCLTGVEQADSVLEINLATLAHTEGQENCAW
jgi:hypothetical protein